MGYTPVVQVYTRFTYGNNWEPWGSEHYTSKYHDGDPTTYAQYNCGTTAITSQAPGFGRPGIGISIPKNIIRMIAIVNGPDPNCNVSSYTVRVKNMPSDPDFVSGIAPVFSGLSTEAGATNVLNITGITTEYSVWFLFPNADTAIQSGNTYYPWKVAEITFYTYSDADKISYITSDEG